MPRKSLQKTDRLPYHVTGRTNNREDLPVPVEQFWKVITTECLTLSILYHVEFQAFVLMPNHFHLLMTVPAQDLGIVMNYFMSSVTRTTHAISGRCGHLFGGPYFRSLIGSSRYFGHALKYVYRNPVRAGLCTRVEDYPFSTLHGLLGSSHLPFPIHFTRAGLELAVPDWESGDYLEWLNRPFPAEAEERIRKGLRRQDFTTLLDRRTRRPVEELEPLL